METQTENIDPELNGTNGNSNDTENGHSENSDTKEEKHYIKLVSLSKLIDKPKAWVKEALAPPEIISLDSTDSDGKSYTSSLNLPFSKTNGKATNNKNSYKKRRRDSEDSDEDWGHYKSGSKKKNPRGRRKKKQVLDSSSDSDLCQKPKTRKQKMKLSTEEKGRLARANIPVSMYNQIEQQCQPFTLKVVRSTEIEFITRKNTKQPARKKDESSSDEEIPLVQLNSIKNSKNKLDVNSDKSKNIRSDRTENDKNKRDISSEDEFPSTLLKPDCILNTDSPQSMEDLMRSMLEPEIILNDKLPGSKDGLLDTVQYDNPITVAEITISSTDEDEIAVINVKPGKAKTLPNKVSLQKDKLKNKEKSAKNMNSFDVTTISSTDEEDTNSSSKKGIKTVENFFFKKKSKKNKSDQDISMKKETSDSKPVEENSPASLDTPKSETKKVKKRVTFCDSEKESDDDNERSKKLKKRTATKKVPLRDVDGYEGSDESDQDTLKTKKTKKIKSKTSDSSDESDGVKSKIHKNSKSRKSSGEFNQENSKSFKSNNNQSHNYLDKTDLKSKKKITRKNCDQSEDELHKSKNSKSLKEKKDKHNKSNESLDVPDSNSNKKCKKNKDHLDEGVKSNKKSTNKKYEESGSSDDFEDTKKKRKQEMKSMEDSDADNKRKKSIDKNDSREESRSESRNRRNKSAKDQNSSDDFEESPKRSHRKDKKKKIKKKSEEIHKNEDIKHSGNESTVSSNNESFKEQAGESGKVSIDKRKTKSKKSKKKIAEEISDENLEIENIEKVKKNSSKNKCNSTIESDEIIPRQKRNKPGEETTKALPNSQNSEKCNKSAESSFSDKEDSKTDPLEQSSEIHNNKSNENESGDNIDNNSSEKSTKSKSTEQNVTDNKEDQNSSENDSDNEQSSEKTNDTKHQNEGEDSSNGSASSENEVNKSNDKDDKDGDDSPSKSKKRTEAKNSDSTDEDSNSEKTPKRKISKDSDSSDNSKSKDHNSKKKVKTLKITDSSEDSNLKTKTIEKSKNRRSKQSDRNASNSSSDESDQNIQENRIKSDNFASEDDPEDEKSEATKAKSINSSPEDETENEKITTKNSTSSEEESDEKHKSLDSDASEKFERPKRSRRTAAVESDDSDSAKRKSKSKISDDSDDDFFNTKLKRSIKVSSDSDDDDKETGKRKRTGKYEDDSDFEVTSKKIRKNKSSSSGGENDDDPEEKPKKTAKNRRRIKTVHDSSAESGDDNLNNTGDSSRKKIRKVLGKDELSKKTIDAAKDEMERKKRILERQKLYNEINAENVKKITKLDKIVLDFDPDKKKDLIKVHKTLVKKLKPHQAGGVKFMWDCCFESVELTKKGKGSGCILAHCMGLGKTLQVVTLIHTLITHWELTGVKKVMVVCPLSTVLNWVNELTMWLKDINDGDDVNVFELTKSKQMIDRSYQIKDWEECGGVLVLGYEMYRNLTNSTNKRIKKKIHERFQSGLVDPGPDLVVCDEGHLLKNEKSRLSIAMNKIKTLRRIVLTGTPLQNNLKEYFCMINFVKPNLLGTYKEYTNRFVNPITNGQYTDSTQRDIEVMRRRSHVLHKLLDGVVQRRDYEVLAPFLPPKNEYVLFLTLSEVQINLYDAYMRDFAKRSQPGKAVALFTDFQELQRIWTHPRSLRFYSDNYAKIQEKKDFLADTDSEGSLKDFLDDGNSSSSNKSGSGDGSDSDDDKNIPPRGRMTRGRINELKEIGQYVEEEVTVEKKDNPTEWWCRYVDDEVLEDFTYSSKLKLLFEVLKKCEAIGDKVLVFSQSLFSLDLIQYFLDKIDDATQNADNSLLAGLGVSPGSWSLGLDYFRLDGSSSVESRAAWCKTFNDTENIRARLFLISTKAGGLGINLVAANRVIIFDVSWNPSHDIQSIFRVYRFGQLKPCYIYRFIAMGTMEEKVYERQVTKQAISKRVIDEQQIDRHYNQNDLNELYKFTPTPEEPRPIPNLPKDRLLAELLKECEKEIFKFHEHESLLENKEEEELDEEERKAAWDEFETEKNRPTTAGTTGINSSPMLQMTVQDATIAMTTWLRTQNPSWGDLQLQQSVAMLVQQMYQLAAAGDWTMYNRILSYKLTLQQQQWVAQNRLINLTSNQQRPTNPYEATRFASPQTQQTQIRNIMYQPPVTRPVIPAYQNNQSQILQRSLQQPHQSQQTKPVKQNPQQKPTVKTTGASRQQPTRRRKPNTSIVDIDSTSDED